MPYSDFASYPHNLFADDVVPKQVALIVNGKRLIASNVRLSRFDEFKLNAQEEITDQEEGAAVIVVVTNQRLIAYGVVSGWKDLRKQAGERLETLSVEDFAAFATTSSRYLNFNGQSGQWGQRDRRVARVRLGTVPMYLRVISAAPR